MNLTSTTYGKIILYKSIQDEPLQLNGDPLLPKEIIYGSRVILYDSRVSIWDSSVSLLLWAIGLLGCKLSDQIISELSEFKCRASE